MSGVGENLMKPLRSENLHWLLICLVWKGAIDPTIILVIYLWSWMEQLNVQE
jgi:hypothetical protein